MTAEQALKQRRVDTFLRSRGAESVPHPGGSLYLHLQRVSTLLSNWGASHCIQLVGACHATYGTDGFDHALLHLEHRDTLVELIGPQAEALVYLYCSCDRKAVYPQLAATGPVPFTDRFSGRVHTPPEPAVRAFVEVSAANELDALTHNPDLAAKHAATMLALLSSTRDRLSDAAWRAWLDQFGHLRPQP